MHCPVNIPWDITGPISPNMHGLILPPPVPPALANTLAIEMLTTVAWTAGYVLGKNKFAKTVKHKGGYIMQEGHDIGPLIPDVTIPPTNLWYLKMWPLSKREVKFAASKVKMCGKATGCASLINAPPFLMITCGEPVSWPIASSYLAVMNTVRVGVSCMDFLAGVLSIVVSIGLDLVMNKIMGGSWNPFKSASEAITTSITRKILGSIGMDMLTDLGKNLVSGLCGMGITALTGTGTPQFKFAVGNAWVGGELTLGGGWGIEGHAMSGQLGTGSGDAAAKSGWQGSGL